jgi:3-oxoacyl-[acyl-carrier-protein] synthase II
MGASVAITGIGLLSALGEGGDAHWAKLCEHGAQPIVDETRFAPYPVHPLGPVDFATQISKKGDLRQMEPWQRIGTFTAGLALADAGIAGCPEFLDETDMIVAAGSGERDTATDIKVLETISARDDGDILANEILPSNLRPTLFLAQLSNLLAGNISIVHKVTGSSRTFMGEEMAGISAVETAVRRINAGQGKLFLVGGAFNSEREDALLNFELGGMLLNGPFKPVWERATNGDSGGESGFVPASIGAFLVLEERAHAEARGAKVYAEVKQIVSGRSSRKEGAAAAIAQAQFSAVEGELHDGPLAVLSGASGAQPATGEELKFLSDLDQRGHAPTIRAYGSVLGHGVEAHFPLGIALAALAIRNGAFFPPFEAADVERGSASTPEQVLVTGWGHWRGEAMALVAKAGPR